MNVWSSERQTEMRGKDKCVEFTDRQTDRDRQTEPERD